MTSPETPKSTPLTVTPSPLDMPGAQRDPIPPAISTPMTTATAPEPKPAEPTTPDSVTVQEREELARLRNFKEASKDWESIAKKNLVDANKFRQISEQLGEGQPGSQSNEFDARAEIQRLRDEAQAERTERLREQVARETGVPPTQIVGSDGESMKASAVQALEWAKGLVQQQPGVPLVAPAANVNANQKTHENGVEQIQSRDDLKSMSQKEIMEAYRSGRLKHLTGEK